MRKLIITIIVIAVILAAGCATTSNVEKPGDVSKTVEKPQEEKTAVVETVEIPYVVKDTSYFSDGYIESYKVYTYGDDMAVVREDLFDSFDEIIESVVYEAAAVNEVRRSLLDARGTVLSWKKIITNDEGDVVRLESYSVEDKLQSVSEYEYDDYGNKISWKVLDGDGVVLSDTRYIYEGGNNTRIDIYDASSSLQEYFESVYGDDGLLRTVHYGEDGKSAGSVEYIYEGGVVVLEKHLRANGSVSRTVKIGVDEKGNPVKLEYYDGNGKLKDWTSLEYEYVSEEITVWK